ncbi:poly(A) polymerase 3 [Arabidopsis thaliana]|uniref:Nuclear poly(A) polymerase 3 n=2 Tax=Arabidopsis thaliana TaxID=3702 RepID=PAPS3_ARATH|nr:poly(A) polymerase 3 [Arabidopsis thaliana]Q56XM9.1 RecName: Full=Nuclear poly(A) polymerase 3; Short=PAP(III); Short=Poly(A) polymerase III; AltName: Full=Polynucleotide adenylyltransferase 3 [Arabidopsis thaliana]AEE74415.1 poly(A) polymerase 3 [Arabidopsis thaliana]BAD95301.1 poly(A) polymerase [Arabidopsis thaliana]|eukprot:NP_187308.3 poly(A) polymerase 3 [Arabidopsis thaliana]
MKKGGGRNKGFPQDDESSISLRQLMVNEGLIPSLEDEVKRRGVINQLRKIVVRWVKNVAWQHRLPQNQIDATNATILPYGSYGLGVYGSESDIDALCIGPFFASIAEDFFISLRDMLKSRREVSELHCVKDAKVPLIRFKFDGILVDLPYAQLRVLSIPNNVDVLNPFFLRDIDETSWKILSGVRANKCILQLVPSLELFQSLLRCVKLWAKRRGVYGNLNGFLGGVHMAILAAFVCGYQPNATLSSLLANFFYTFAHWQWPTPVVLLEDTYPSTGAPPGLMPIQLPCGSHQYCNSTITRSTFYKIVAEFLLGHNLTKDYLKLNFSWKDLFELYPYANTYTWFTKIHLSAANQEDLSDWVGWVKSRFRCLLIKIEEVYGICDPNPTEYVETYTKQPNIVFYWGLQLRTINVSDIESVKIDFLKNVNSGSFRGTVGRIQLTLVKASQLPKNGECGSNNRSKKVTKTCWRIREDKQCNNVPVYSKHLPGYVVGYQKMVNREADGMEVKC